MKSLMKKKSQQLCNVGLFLIGEFKDAYGTGKIKVKLMI